MLVVLLLAALQLISAKPATVDDDFDIVIVSVLDDEPELNPADYDCSLKPVIGDCKAQIQSYYYDTESQSCKLFIYGGCGGNSNRFNSQADCQKICSGFTEEKNDFQLVLSDFLVSGSEREERFFVDFGQCDDQPSHCPRDCDMYTDDFGCNACDCDRDNISSSASENGREKPRYCTDKPERGPCRSRHYKYHFDVTTNSCEEFLYGGCLGNENNFWFREDCEAACM